MENPVVLVLPIHNGEQHLPSLVTRILELGIDAACPLSIVILDDGSTDDTFETACELATEYPQIQVLRQPLRQGLPAAIDRVRRLKVAQRVIVHDGVSPLDAAELTAMLREAAPGDLWEFGAQAAPTDPTRGSRRFAAITRLHTALERAHSSVSSLRWVELSETAAPRRVTGVASSALGDFASTSDPQSAAPLP